MMQSIYIDLSIFLYGVVDIYVLFIAYCFHAHSTEKKEKKEMLSVNLEWHSTLELCFLFDIEKNLRGHINCLRYYNEKRNHEKKTRNHYTNIHIHVRRNLNVPLGKISYRYYYNTLIFSYKHACFRLFFFFSILPLYISAYIG